MFGERLKRIRIELRLSQQQFGDFFGVTKQCVGYWENNKRDIPNYAIDKLREACNGYTINPIIFLVGCLKEPFGTCENKTCLKSAIFYRIVDFKK